MKLQVFHTINNANRISSVDIFRSIAIISVVLFHFNRTLPYGFLGVDLFFLISGLLIGGQLTKEFESGVKINFFKFFLQRGFKIWPSYYFFLLVGSLLAWLFYRKTDADQLIHFADLSRYLFFYQNYTGVPFHWSFDHVWSLCIEEHFYILLPLMYLLLQNFVASKHQTKFLFLSVVLTILTGIVFKYISFYYTKSHDTYSATHNRIDALAWGVLLNLVIRYFPEKIKVGKNKMIAFLLGAFLFIAALIYSIKFEDILFNKIYFHSIMPFSFFLMLMGLYYYDFSRLKPLRVVAYYSYNWYLWHTVFVIVITNYIGNTFIGLIVYIILTFAMAVFSTTFIEETVLKKRNKFISKIFKSANKE